MNQVRYWLFLWPCLVLLGIAAFLCLYPNRPFPGATQRISRQRRGIEQTIHDIERLAHENHQLKGALLPMEAIRQGACRINQDGATLLRERLDNATTKAQITLRAMGEIRKNNLTEDELEFYEVSFSTECTLKEFLIFTQELEKPASRLYWRNLTLRANTTGHNDLLSLSGSVVLIALGGGR